MKINHLDLFSGIGGFHLGFERAGFKIKSYFSEIDKHAIAVYKNKFKDATYVGSVTDVRGEDLPRIDLITFGSPCQDFSLAGKRAGMGGDRSSLILEAIRLVRECRPRVFIWENVKGAFSSNSGEDFAAILQEFADIGGYRLEWQLLNTSWFLPQNRERIYLVGYSTTPKRGWRGVFPIGKASQSNSELERTGEAITKCLTARGQEGHAGMQLIKVKQIGTKFDSNSGTQPSVSMKWERTEEGKRKRKENRDKEGKDYSSFQDRRLTPSDKPISNTITSFVEKDALIAVVQPFACFGNNKESQFYKDVSKAPALKASNQTNPRSGGTTLIGIQANYDSKALNETIENSNLIEGEPQALDLYNRVARDESPTLTEPHHNSLRMFDGYRIRRLTPIECERLQGFPDDHTSFGNYDGEVKPVSNTQRYKQCGNAVTVDVVSAVAKKCIPLFK
jgi:DNA (cytosine-5)-methyltransferase 1